MKVDHYVPRLARVLAVTMVVAAALSPAAARGKFKVLYNFPGGNDGSGPQLFAALAMDAGGNLYGAAGGGSGTNCDHAGCGVVFEMVRGAGGKWSENVIYQFTNWQSADSPLTPDSQGSLYGCTQEYGPMFELTPGVGQWTFIPIWQYGCGGPVGLILDGAGDLYGAFGNNSSGGISELSPTSRGWVYTNLYEFCPSGVNCRDGQTPLAPFSWDAQGNLYGTTWSGGLVNYPDCGGYCGVAFQLAHNGDGTWTYHVMHRFDSFKGDGYLPYGGLTVDASGNAYGTTTHGGPYYRGTVFRLTQAKTGHWKETILYDFPYDGVPAAPGNDLVFDKSGNLYGAADGNNCNYGCGVVFKLTPQKSGKWKCTVLHQFNWTDGTYPNGLTMDSQGHLYGTTTGGGKYGYGVVFEITP